MELNEALQQRIKNERRILFDIDDLLIVNLMCLICEVPKRGIVPRALALAQESVDILKIRYPLELRPKKTVDHSFIVMKVR